MNTKTKAWTEMTTEEQLVKALEEVKRLEKILDEVDEQAEEDAKMYKHMGAYSVLECFAKNWFFEAVEDASKAFKEMTEIPEQLQSAKKVVAQMKGFMHDMHIEPYGYKKGEVFVVNNFDVDNYDYTSAWYNSYKSKKVKVLTQGYKTRDNSFCWKHSIYDVED